ncbi:MAG: M81 family metallopeptidase [Alphaproteobacteria bacterium]|nr:M81 family metallopeptidase [Alphaproteobacteria bacterium]
MARIAIGGIHHETNTFAPVKADLYDFEHSAGSPRAPRGTDVITETQGLNIPIAGFIDEARAMNHDLVPTHWAHATPSAHVTDNAFDTITGRILDDLRAAMPVDAVYLCLHGAMVTESHQDGEGELLRRVREVVGPHMPVVVSLDLHSNTTQQMMDLSSALIAYRTYPHVDSAETGRRAAQVLDRILNVGEAAKAFRRPGFLIPLVWQCTMIEPANSIYERLRAMEHVAPSLFSLSFTPGFPAADIAECGPAVMAYADTPKAADEAADELARMVVNSEGQFAGTLYEPDDGVREAMRRYNGKPVVLADTQDNPGAGGASDTVGLLEALVRNKAEDAVFAMLFDPPAAQAAHEAGIGGAIERGIGASTGQKGQSPFQGRFTVEALSDGVFTGTGPMRGGSRFQMGPTAVLRIDGVRILVTSAKSQVHDQAMLRHIGIDPEQMKIVALKSSVHFRNDFTDLAGDILVVVAPGPNVADHLALDYKHLRPGIRLTPLGPEYEP